MQIIDIVFGGSLVSIVGFVLVNAGVQSAKRKTIYDKLGAMEKNNEGKYVGAKLCDERSGNMQANQDKMDQKLDTILVEVRKRNGNR